MDAILSFIRDKVVGIPYFLLVVVAIFLIFAIIGYLVSLNYKPINKLVNTKTNFNEKLSKCTKKFSNNLLKFYANTRLFIEITIKVII